MLLIQATNGPTLCYTCIALWCCTVSLSWENEASPPLLPCNLVRLPIPVSRRRAQASKASAETFIFCPSQSQVLEMAMSASQSWEMRRGVCEVDLWVCTPNYGVNGS